MSYKKTALYLEKNSQKVASTVGVCFPKKEVFFYALKFCDMEPQQFMPAALIGIALYFIKALHIGKLGEKSWLVNLPP